MKGIECCGDCVYYNWKKHRCTRGAHVDTKPASEFFADCPLKDVQPVRHGRWLTTDNGVWPNVITGNPERKYLCDCSVCGWRTGNQGLRFNYCPHCGAKIEKEDPE